jgi:serine/threonine protein kinase
MGEVWKARDPRLQRTVAVKICKEQFSERFDREARSIAALNHPNICQVYDVGPNYLVMEYIDGKPLAGPLSLDRALDYAIQICSALEAAHQAGIIHRDLKPANILVTKSGLKLLDFGVAKITAVVSTIDATQSETLALTKEGTVPGTLRYMSPEQVQGRELDTRSDIFSLGAVLFELFSGKRAFPGQTAADVIANIISGDPPRLSGVLPSVIPAIDDVVRTCLKKDVSDRWQSARELKHALNWIGSQPRSARNGFWRPRVWWAVLAFSVGLGGAVGAMRWFKPSYREPLSIETLTYSGRDLSPVASPDNRTIVFSSDRDGTSRIWLKQLQTGAEIALTSGSDDSPRFSPDGATILYARNEPGGGRALYAVASVGGASNKVVQNAINGDFSPDGHKVAFVRWRKERDHEDSIVALADRDGSDITEIARVPGTRLDWPRWSPDGNTIATVSAPGASRLQLCLVDRTKPHKYQFIALFQQTTPVAWLADNRTVAFIRGDRTAPLRADLVLLDTKTKAQRTITWPCCSLSLDTAGAGQLVFDNQATRSGLLEMDNEGRRERWLSWGNSADRQPVYSPDGRYIAFASNRNGKINIWQISLSDGALTRLTDGLKTDYDPAFSRDGRHLIFSSNRTGHFEIYIANADGSDTKQVTRDGFNAQNGTITPDNQWVIYASNSQEPGIWRIHPDGTKPTPLVHGNCFNPEVSPDGKYALYVTSPSGDSTEIHVIQIPEGSATPFVIHCPSIRRIPMMMGRARWIASQQGGNPKAIAFIGQDNRGAVGIYVQDFVTNRQVPSTPRPLKRFDLRSPLETLAVSPEGRNLVVSVADYSSAIMLASNVPGLNVPEHK